MRSVVFVGCLRVSASVMVSAAGPARQPPDDAEADAPAAPDNAAPAAGLVGWRSWASRPPSGDSGLDQRSPTRRLEVARAEGRSPPGISIPAVSEVARADHRGDSVFAVQRHGDRRAERFAVQWHAERYIAPSERFAEVSPIDGLDVSKLYLDRDKREQLEKQLKKQLPKARSIVGQAFYDLKKSITGRKRRKFFQLGKGSFGSVKLVKLDLGRGEENVAVKVMHKKSDQRRSQAVLEGCAQMIAASRSAQVAQIRFVLTQGKYKGYIGMQPYMGGELHDFLDMLEEQGKRLEDVFPFGIVEVVAQIGQAILDLHGTSVSSYRIAHHDLKLSNILMKDTALGPGAGLYVTDFGLAHMDVTSEREQKRVSDLLALADVNLTLYPRSLSGYERRSTAGTEEYMGRVPAGPEHDWYSFGVLLWAMSGQFPKRKVSLGEATREAGLENCEKDKIHRALCYFLLDVWQEVAKVADLSLALRPDVVDDFVRNHEYFKVARHLWRGGGYL